MENNDRLPSSPSPSSSLDALSIVEWYADALTNAASKDGDVNGKPPHIMRRLSLGK